eukprot:TRINITY_DN4082_c0_g2_i2.p1 TRINITY_DN4082_c0_g2~~TRINITY_DN4082_c0_g2_i2.p1  ORF type:complete len:142 (-),score=46.57 TRINITY_DN4082_c0_g2_i2:60-485(-)
MDAEDSEHLIEAFQMMDTSNTGKLNLASLNQLLRSLGYSFKDSEVKKMMDEHGSGGYIGRDDFINAIVLKGSQQDSELLAAFNVFDKEQNGYVSAAELKHLLSTLGDEFNEEEVDDFVREADVDNDGQINYKHFILTKMRL